MTADPHAPTSELKVHSNDPLCAGPDVLQLIESYETPVPRHYVRNHGDQPEVDRGAYRLEVGGLVARSLALSLDELAERFPSHALTATLQCAGNRRSELHAVRPFDTALLWTGDAVGTATWTGVRLADVLVAAGLRDRATHVWFEGLDQVATEGGQAAFGSSIALARALEPDVLLAYAMNGVALPVEHGAPLRLVVPGQIGARSVKWLARVEVANGPSENPFQVGYRLEFPGQPPGPPLESAPLNAYACEPAPGAHLTAGETRMDGYATPSGTALVTAAEISLDGGPWREADLLDPPTPGTWVRWEAHAQLHPGEHELRVRARDSSGAVQPPSVPALWNARGYANNAWHQVTFTAEEGSG